MILGLSIDLFLDEMIALYGDIADSFDPNLDDNKKANPQYEEISIFFRDEREKLHLYITEGLFVDEESRTQVLISLSKATELLPLLKQGYLSHKSMKTVRSITQEAIRLRNMVQAIDTLED